MVERELTSMGEDDETSRRTGQKSTCVPGGTYGLNSNHTRRIDQMCRLSPSRRQFRGQRRRTDIKLLQRAARRCSYTDSSRLLRSKGGTATAGLLAAPTGESPEQAFQLPRLPPAFLAIGAISER